MKTTGRSIIYWIASAVLSCLPYGISVVANTVFNVHKSVMHISMSGKYTYAEPQEVGATGSFIIALVVIIFGVIEYIVRKDKVVDEKSERLTNAIWHTGVAIGGFLAFLFTGFIFGAVHENVDYLVRTALFLVSALLWVISYIIRDVPPNRILGVRTASTLSSEIQWKAVHGNLFKYTSIATLLSAMAIVLLDVKYAIIVSCILFPSCCAYVTIKTDKG